MVNINCVKGTKVKFTNDCCGGFLTGKDNYLLILGETYTIDHTEVHSFHTKVYLKEYPNSVFNSVCFE